MSIFGAEEFISVLDRMSVKLQSKLGSFLRIKTNSLERHHNVKAVDGSTHSQKDI